MASSDLDPKDSAILSKIADKYHAFIVGEDDNIKLLFLACIAKDLPKKLRIHIILIGESSSGKSYILRTVTKPFDYDDILLDYTDFTSAWLKRHNDTMDGRIFLLEQLENQNSHWQVSISDMKFLLSEGKLKMGLVDVDGKGRRTRTTLEVNGIPAFLTTSTKYTIDPETLNRTFLASMDESNEQTSRIVKHTLNDYAVPEYVKKSDDLVSQLRELAKTYKTYAKAVEDIVLPFAPKLESLVPIIDVKIRRDFKKLLNLACIIALMHVSIRKKVVIKKKVHYFVDQFAKTEEREVNKFIIIGELQDFQEALSIVGKTFFQTIHNVTEKAMRVYEAVKQICDKNDGIAKVKEISERTSYSETRTRELLNSLVGAGFLHKEKEGRENLYSTSSKEFSRLDLSSITYSDEEFQQWYKETFPKEAELIVPNVSVESLNQKEQESYSVSQNKQENATINETVASSNDFDDNKPISNESQFNDVTDKGVRILYRCKTCGCGPWDDHFAKRHLALESCRNHELEEVKDGSKAS